MARQRKREKQFIGLFLVAFLVFVIAMFFISYYVLTYVEPTNKYFQAYNKVINNELSDMVREQKKMNEEFAKAKKNKSFTFENPYIKQNPYGINPLSALIIFTTDENLKTKITINGNEVTTMEATKQHVVPVYGLYANFENEVTLELSDGSKRTYEIITAPYNDDLGDIRLNRYVKKNQFLMVVGDLNKNDSNLRGFDYYGNLLLYLDLDYINGVSYYKNRIYVSYNSANANTNGLETLKLEMDYLGQIYSISNKTDDINKKSNLDINGPYIYQTYDLYNNYLTTYDFVEPYDYTPNTEGNVYAISSMKEELDNAKAYDKKVNIYNNGNYVSFDFKEDKYVIVIMVFKDSNFVQQYTVTNKNMIKVRKDRDVSLYAYIDGKYYSLLTTLKN